MRRLLVCISTFVLVGAWCLAQQEAPAPDPSSVKVEIQADRVVAFGLTPGGQAVWFAVSKERAEWMAKIVRYDRLVMADPSGDSAFVPDAKVSPVSVWAVVDMTTGAYAMQTHSGMPTHLVSFPSAALKAEEGGDYSVSDSRQALEVLLVRPGEGAWRLSLADGGPDDGDGAPNRVLVPNARSFHSLMPDKAPLKGFHKGDVMLAIDPVTFDHYAGQIGPPKD